MYACDCVLNTHTCAQAGAESTYGLCDEFQSIEVHKGEVQGSRRHWEQGRQAGGNRMKLAGLRPGGSKDEFFFPLKT